MRLAHLDTSCLVVIAFDEPGSRRVAARLGRVDRLLSSNLLEAELRSTFVREGLRRSGEAMLAGITWILPDRPLSREIHRIVAAGCVKGADVWHLASAPFLAPEGRDLASLTLDRRPQAVASGLGFAT